MSQAASNAIVVHDRAEFDAAVQTLQSTGGEIQIASGAPAFKIHLWGVDAAAEITVTSEDPGNASHVSSATIFYSSNFSFDNLVFDEMPTTGIRGTKYYNVQTKDSQDLSFTNNVFEGGATGMLGIDDPDEGNRGPFIRDTTNVVFEGNTFTGHLHALTLMDSTNIQVLDNEFTKMQADGIELAGVQNVLIQGNTMHDMLGTANDIWHGDMIQYWAANTNQAIQNVVIRDNFLNAGDISYQGIFGQNTGSTFRPDGLVIENNTIITGGPNGIYLNNFDNVQITNNTVLANLEAKLVDTDGTLHTAAEPRILLQDVNNAVVDSNIGKLVPNNNTNLPNSNVVETNNQAVNYTNPDHPNHVDNVFVNAGNCGDTDARDFQQLADSPLAGLGSDLADSLAKEALTDPHCVIEGVRVENGDTQEVSYSVHNPDPALTYVWTFEDGTQVAGPTATRFFRDAGMHTVTLEAMSGGQVVETMARSTVVDSAQLVRLEFDSMGENGPDLAGADLARFDSSYLKTVTDGPDGTATTVYELDGTNPFYIAKSNDFLGELDEFSMVIDLRRTDLSSGGQIVALPNGLELYLNTDGSMRVSFSTTDMSKTVNTVGQGLMGDTGWHSVGVSYSQEDGALSVRVDDGEIFSMAVSGHLEDYDRDMQIGSRYSTAGLKSQIDEIHIVDYATTSDSQVRDSDAYLDALAGVAPDPDSSGGPSLGGGPVPGATTDPDVVTDSMSLADLFAGTDAFWVSSGFEGTDDTTGSVTVHFTTAGLDTDFDPDGVTGQGLDLEGQSKDGVEISRDVDGIHGLSEFTLGVSARIDAGSQTGDLIYLPKAFRLRYVEGKGIEFQLATDEDGDPGTAPVNQRQMFDTQAFEDGSFHRLVVSYDGTGGGLTLYVDGSELGTMDVSGLTPGRTYYGMSIGSKWQDSAEAVLDDFIFADRAVDASEVADDQAAFVEDLYGVVLDPLPADDGPQGVALNDVFSDSGAFWIESEFEGTADAGGSVHLTLDSTNRDVDYSADGVTGQGLELEGQSNDGLEISRNVDEIHALDEFTIAASVQVDGSSATGDLIYLPKAFRLRYVEGQGVEFQLATDEDGDAGTADVNHKQIFQTQAFEDGAFHRLVATYDSNASTVTLYVDGASIGEMTVTGLTPDKSYYGMSIGSKWQDSATAVLDDFVFANQAVTDDHVADDHAAFVEDYTTDMFDDAAAALNEEAIMEELTTAGG